MVALHCPATLLVAPAPVGAKGVAALAESLAEERVLGVVGAPGDEAARRVAEILDVPLEDEPGLAAAQHPDPAVLGEIADLHRGETVVVLTPPAEVGAAPFTRLELD